ncbi:MAG: ROK family protein [Candidatus Buchananbacteria bacterium]
MQKAAVGFDLGGSHCRAAVVDEQGKIIGETVWTPIDKTMSAEEIVASMADIITQAQLMAKGAGYEIVGCGGGAPGPMNMATGVILNTPNLVALRQFPLAEKLSQAIGLPVYLNNDANLTVLGETLAGAGKGFASVYGCTLGTGFGHGWVIDGKIHVGRHCLAMEHARSPVSIEDDSTIEHMVSASGITKKYMALGGNNWLSPQDIAEAAAAGNKEAKQVFAYLGKWLGFTFSWIQNTLDVDAILVGGNIAKAWNHFAPTMFTALHKHTFSEVYEVPVLPMSLGETAGIIGGGLLALNQK